MHCPRVPCGPSHPFLDPERITNTTDAPESWSKCLGLAMEPILLQGTCYIMLYHVVLYHVVLDTWQWPWVVGSWQATKWCSDRRGDAHHSWISLSQRLSKSPSLHITSYDLDFMLSWIIFQGMDHQRAWQECASFHLCMCSFIADGLDTVELFSGTVLDFTNHNRLSHSPTTIPKLKVLADISSQQSINVNALYSDVLLSPGQLSSLT